MLRCPLPPAPIFDPTASLSQLLIPTAVMLVIALSGLFLPGRRRHLWQAVGIGLGSVMLVSGYALEYGYGHPWYAALLDWQNHMLSIRGCFTDAVAAFSQHEMAFVIHVTTVGNDLTFFGVLAGIMPTAWQTAEVVSDWIKPTRRRNRGNEEVTR